MVRSMFRKRYRDKRLKHEFALPYLYEKSFISLYLLIIMIEVPKITQSMYIQFLRGLSLCRI